MQANLYLLNPVYELSSLQLFYETMENYVRGLESLERSHETYGDPLVPIVLGKIPVMCAQIWLGNTTFQNGSSSS